MHPHRASSAYRVFLLAAILALRYHAHAEFTIAISGAAGYYLLPDEVSGNVIRDTYESGGWVLPEPYVTQDRASSAYDQSGYRFRHSFGAAVSPNVGCILGPAYYFKSGFGLGADIAYGFSIRDLVSSSSESDSLGPDANSIIPHDYRVQTAESSDRMRVKHVTLGLFLGKRWMPRPRFGVTAGLGIGWANYVGHFQLESNLTTTSYRQANGHEVYRDSIDGEFTVFGIRYAGLYLRPGATVSCLISERVSLDAGASVPLSYIDKGYDWWDGGGLSHTAVLYPSQRFIAGNILVHAGLRFHIGKKG